MSSRNRRLYFALAGLTLVLCWGLFLLVYHNARSQALFWVGIVLLVVGLLLIALAIGSLQRRGRHAQGEPFTATKVVVTEGIYKLVRHPLYLGWLLLYPAAMLVSQHALVIVLGALGMLAMEGITRGADELLRHKFGAEYEAYMREVPPLNIVLGIVRRLRGR